MKKVLVTGGAGFIGRHLVARLVAEGTAVVVLDNLKRSSLEAAAALRATGVEVVEGDIRDFATVARACAGCDVVFHLAAQSNVMGATEDPDYSITTNVLGTHNVLRAAAEGRVPRLVFTSSREVYGDPTSLPVAEDAPLAAKNAYGASKLAGEAYCRTFANGGMLSVQTVRLANVYGPGDSGRVIPLWATAAQRGDDLRVYGGEQIIDFLWVGTAVGALLFAAKNDLPGPINVGSGVGTKIMDLAARILTATNSRSRIVRIAPREIEVAKFTADVTKMRALGLTPDRDPLQHLEEFVGAYGR